MLIILLELLVSMEKSFFGAVFLCYKNHHLTDRQNIWADNRQKCVWRFSLIFSRRVEIIPKSPIHLGMLKQMFLLINPSSLILKGSSWYWPSFLFVSQQHGSWGANDLKSFHVTAKKAAKPLFSSQAQWWFMRCFSAIQPAKAKILAQAEKPLDEKKAQWSMAFFED